MKASDLVVTFIGPSGCGKGTQSKLLRRDFGFSYIGSGNLLRKKAEETDFTGRKVHKIIDEGKLVSSLVIAGLWEKEMERIKDLPKFSGLIIDGSPRSLFEAKLIDSGLEWYEWSEKHRVLFLNISYEESKKRLLARHREDDTIDALERRWAWYREQTLPVIEYYRQKNLLIEINAEPSVEEVYQSVKKALSL